MNDRPALPEPLQAVLNQLGRHEHVRGALLIGSLPAGHWSAASDYDLVVVVTDLAPRWYVGVTTIGGRFADIIFVAASALAEIIALERAAPHDHPLAPILRWLRDGQIVLDHAGSLRRVQDEVHLRHLLAPPASDTAYGAWFGLNYNLAVLTRLLGAEDACTLLVADIRLAVYGASDLWFSYFAIRGQAWSGDKAAVRALEEQDPHYLAQFHAFLAEPQRHAKARLYRELAALAAAPLGGLWPDGWTGENLAEPPVRVAELFEPS